MPTKAYANSSAQIQILKELCDGAFESTEDKLLREFINICAKMNGLPETPEPKSSFDITDLVYSKIRFLEMIPKDDSFKGAYIPLPVKYEK